MDDLELLVKLANRIDPRIVQISEFDQAVFWRFVELISGEVLNRPEPKKRFGMGPGMPDLHSEDAQRLVDHPEYLKDPFVTDIDPERGAVILEHLHERGFAPSEMITPGGIVYKLGDSVVFALRPLVTQLTIRAFDPRRGLTDGRTVEVTDGTLATWVHPLWITHTPKVG